MSKNLVYRTQVDRYPVVGRIWIIRFPTLITFLFANRHYNHTVHIHVSFCGWNFFPLLFFSISIPLGISRRAKPRQLGGAFDSLFFFEIFHLLSHNFTAINFSATFSAAFYSFVASRHSVPSFLILDRFLRLVHSPLYLFFFKEEIERLHKDTNISIHSSYAFSVP